MNFQVPFTLKQFALIALIACLALLSGGYVASIFNKKNPTPNPTQSPAGSPVALTTVASPTPSPKQIALTSPTPATSTTKSAFTWGVTLRPELFPNPDDSYNFLPLQFKALKELGVNTIRVDYNTTNTKHNDRVLELAKENGIQIVFIIPFGPNDIRTDKNLSTNAYNYVKEIVTKYKGRIAVWQLGTEVATVALRKPDLHGADTVDFPDSTYKPVETWLLAATRATKDADPAAKRLVNDQWIHVGFFDKFIKAGGQFEIIGWNWFSDMGTNIDKPTIDRNTGQTYELMKKLKSYNKEIWITEINRRNGSADGDEKAQADFIETIAKAIKNNTAVNGFIVFHFIGEQGYGIMRDNFTVSKISDKKQAFGRYQTIIKTYRK